MPEEEGMPLETDGSLLAGNLMAGGTLAGDGLPSGRWYEAFDGLPDDLNAAAASRFTFAGNAIEGTLLRPGCDC